MVRRLAAVVAVVLGLGLVVATPVSAQPYWQTYDTSQGVWDCGEPDEVQHGVHLKSCVHYNSNSDAQAVAILSNYSGSHHTITGPAIDLVQDADDDGSYEKVYRGACVSHRLLNNTSRACLGPTKGPFCHWFIAPVQVTVGGLIYHGMSDETRVCVK
jgi:hypothetical protein